MIPMVDHMVDQNATYLTRRRGVHYYYTRRIPKELQKRLGKERIVVSLKTKSRRKAVASAIVLVSQYAASSARYIKQFASSRTVLSASFDSPES